MPVSFCDRMNTFYRNEWQDYWMDYKSFKALITDIGKEKSEKEKEFKDKNSEIGKSDDIVDVDISNEYCNLSAPASLEKEKQFFKELTESVIMVDTFFCKIQVQYVIEVKQLIEEVKKVDSVWIQ